MNQGNTPSILIIGGAGAMGALFREKLEKDGVSVSILEKNDKLDKDISLFDIVILAVPMQLASEIASQVATLVGPKALLCDINSLKQDVCNEMESSQAAEVLGLHPMFGANIPSFDNQTVVSCPIRIGPWSKWLLSWFKNIGCKVVEMDPEKHDKLMSVVQVLNHFSAMTFARAIQAMDIPLEDTLAVTSPVYRIELLVAARIFSQDPNLYYQIASSNPHADSARKALIDAAQELSLALSTTKDEDFMKLFNEVQDFFGSFCQEAQKESKDLISALNKSA